MVDGAYAFTVYEGAKKTPPAFMAKGVLGAATEPKNSNYQRMA
jgi:hypothetical protein